MFFYLLTYERIKRQLGVRNGQNDRKNYCLVFYMSQKVPEKTNKYGGVHKWGFPKIDGLVQGKSQSKMDDNLGYPYDSGNHQIFL